MNKKEQMIELNQLEPIDELDEDEIAIHNDLLLGNYISINNKLNKEKYSRIFKESNIRSKL